MISRRELLAGSAALPLLAASPPLIVKGSLPTPPATPRVPLRTEQLGRVRIDDYAWLKPKNWQEVWRDPSRLDARILAYLQEENRYCDAVLKPTKRLQAKLVREMRRHVPEAAESPAVPDGPWAYYTRFPAGAQQPRYLRKPREGGPEQVLLDGAERARDKPYFSIRNAVHSPDHRQFAWAEDTTGSEKFTIRVKDLTTGRILSGPADAFGDFVFAPDSKYLFWVWRDANSRPRRLYRRLVSGGPDTLVYEEPDAGFLMEVASSASGDWLFLRSFNDVTSEVRIFDAHTPEAEPVLVAPRRIGVDYAIEHWLDRFVMRTNANGAEDYMLMWAPARSPTGPWRPWVPHQAGRTIIELHPRAGDFAWLERVEGNLHVMVCGPDGTPREPVRFSEAAYSLAVQPSEYRENALWITMESPRLPPEWLRCDLRTGEKRTLASVHTPRHEHYVLKRLHARAADGAMVPVTILHSAGTRIDGSAPLLLTGYGAYGYSYETKYSAPVLALVDRGWIWAVAHVRGGSEKGGAWFEAARQLSKKTSFTDFISCAETLIDTRYSRRKRIAIHGFSAPETYDYVASYSPYENVRAQPYPATLATTAIGDDRVGFWEPAKWIAALRRHSTSGKPMVLRTETSGGHQGASGRFDELTEMARMYAFAIWQTEGLRAEDG